MTSIPVSSKGHITFNPNSAQERWLRAMRPGDRMFWRSGVGTGKTYATIFTAQRLAHLNPGIPGLVVSHNLNHVEMEIIVPLVKMLQQAGTYRGKNLRLRVLYMNNGSTIQWAGAHKPDSIDGKNVGWALADEIRHWPEDSYINFVSRIRMPCPFAFEGILTTPELNWIARKFRDNRDFKEIVAKTTENSANLQPSFYERLKRSLSVDVYESYVNGEWMQIGGGVFPEYAETIHVEPDLYDSWHPVHVAFDPAAVLSAALFFQHYRCCEKHNAEHCLHILDELMLRDVPTIWGQQEWLGVYYKNGWRKGIVYLDPAGTARSTSTGLTDVSVLRESGWECKWSTDPFKRAIMSGIRALKGKLKPFKGPPSIYFQPCLLNDSSERGIIRAIQGTAYPEAKGKASDGTPIKDGKLDHALDALRYGIVNLCPLPATSFVRPAT